MKDTLCDMCEEHCEHIETVCRAKAELLPEDAIQQLAETFKILGDATRIKILCVLDRREMCVCDISALLNMSPPAISHHLKSLRQTRLIKYRRDGKIAYYSLDDEHIKAMFSQCLTHVTE